MVAQIDRRFIQARPAKLWPRLLAYALFEGRPLTTRGRWINPLVLAGYRLWGALPQRRAATDPIFILGLGRTGTTVLGTILALHRDLGYLNEPKALWHAALGDDDLIGSYSARPGRYRMGRHDADSGKLRRLRRYHGAYLRLAGCRRVVDKYPELLFRTGLLEAVFPEARLIILIRNGNDTCQSIEQWSARNAAGADDWWGRDRRKWRIMLEELVAPDPYFARALTAIRRFERHRDMAALEWIVTMREALRLRASATRGLFFLRYEDLARKPREQLAALFDFCALERDETVLDYAAAVLRPRPPYPAIELHPALQPLFDETMRTLGYRPSEPA